MPDRKSGDIATGSFLVALGKLEEMAVESKAQRLKLFEQNEKQLELLSGIRISNERILGMVENHDKRLDNLEPRIQSLEEAQQRRKGLMVGIGLGSAVGGGAATTGITALLRKWGVM